MVTAVTQLDAVGHASSTPPPGTERMYAIAFDMDTELLKTHYPTPSSWQNAYADIRRVLNRHGFSWQQGSVYFGDNRINAVTCVMAAIDLSNQYAWFALCVRDVRMLRIEEMNDLMPAVQRSND